MKRSTLCLAIADPPNDNSDPEAPDGDLPEAANDREGSPLSRYKRVLIVEDEWLIASEFENALGAAGFTPVAIAMSYDEAVSSCESASPDFVLMDIRLAGLKNGVEAAIEIHRRWGVRSVFVSAHDASFYPSAAAADPLGWISKPISGEALVRRLRALLPSS